MCHASTVLSDGCTTPAEEFNLCDGDYVRNFIAYNSSLRTPFIMIGFPSAIQLSRVELYFLHYPALNFGLPNFELFRVTNLIQLSGGARVTYILDGNQNLYSGDRRVQRVTLLFNAGSITQRYFRLDMSFSDLYNTEWFLLSEIRFCNLQPQTPPSVWNARAVKIDLFISRRTRVKQRSFPVEVYFNRSFLVDV